MNYSDNNTADTQVEGAPVASLDEASTAAKGESFSKSAIKMIRRQSKDQLVSQVIALNNYAENQKAANMILMYKVKQLNDELLKAHAELLTYRPEPNTVTNEDPKP